MTSDNAPSFEPGHAESRRPYESPQVIEVFIDPAKDMLVSCAPAKTPSHGGPKCATVQFT